MRPPRIGDARALCRQLGARGVIVLAVGSRGDLGGASYGESKRECTALGEVLDAITDPESPLPWADVADAIAMVRRRQLRATPPKPPSGCAP